MFPNYDNLNLEILSGRKLHIFLSGGRLRVCRIEAENDKLLAYGEAPNLETSLLHCNDNIVDKLDYHGQYIGSDAKYPHYLTGESPSDTDYLDRCLWSGNLDFYKEGDKIRGQFNGYDERHNELTITVEGLTFNESLEKLYNYISNRLYGNK